MKKLLFICIILLNVMIFFGCTSKEKSKINSLAEEQQKAVKNSIEFIKNSSFRFKSFMDTDNIEIVSLGDEALKWVWNGDEEFSGRNEVVDSTDWRVTIGSTSQYSLPCIICDSNTLEVIGYIPTK